MASETILKELFEVSKVSSSFIGMKDDDIWNACIAYNELSDKRIRLAINKIKEKEDAIEYESEKRQEKLKNEAEMVKDIRAMEKKDRGNDLENANKILDDFFNI